MSQQLKIFNQDYYPQHKSKEKQQNLQKAVKKIVKNSSRNSKENILFKQNSHKKTNEKISHEKLQCKSLSLLKKQNRQKGSFDGFKFQRKQVKQKNIKSIKQLNTEVKNQYEILIKKNKANTKYKKIEPKEPRDSKRKAKQLSQQKVEKHKQRSVDVENICDKKGLKLKKQHIIGDNSSHKPNPIQSLKLKNLELKSLNNLNLLQKLDKQLQKQDNIKTNNFNQIKPKSYYKRKVSKLSKQIQNLRSLSCKSQQVLEKMQNVRKREEKQFKKKRENYLQEIKKLEQQIWEYRPNIGHIFTYNEFKNGQIVPNNVIPQGGQENSQIGLKMKQKSMYELHRQSNEIMLKYLSQKTNESLESSVKQLCLSILSRQQD